MRIPKRMKTGKDRIPDELLKEIFRKKLNGHRVLEKLYTHIKNGYFWKPEERAKIYV
jgi:hypothetical protein